MPEASKNAQFSIGRLSLRVNFVYSFVGNMTYAACLWAILMTMTKLVRAEEVGLFILATAIIAPIQMFTNLHLRAVQATDAKRLYYFGEYFGLRIITATFTVLVAVLVAVAISLFLGRGLYMIFIMAAVSLFKCADSLADVVYGLMQKYERLDKVAASKTLRGSVAVVIFIASLWLTRNVAISLVSVFVGWAIIFFSFDLRSARKLEPVVPAFNAACLCKLMVLCMPLGITAAMVSLNGGIPRYFAVKYLGSAQLGHFGALSGIVVALGTAVVAMGLTASPRLSRYYIENIRAFVWLLTRMIFIAGGLGAIGLLFGVFFGSQLLTIVYTAEYAEHKTLFLWLLFAGGVTYVSSMLGFGLTAARLFKAQVPLIGIVTLILLISCWLLIPRFGTIGAAWAVLAGTSTQCIGAAAILIWNLVAQKNSTSTVAVKG